MCVCVYVCAYMNVYVYVFMWPCVYRNNKIEYAEIFNVDDLVRSSLV